MGLFDNGWESCSKHQSTSDTLGISTPNTNIKWTNTPWEYGGKGEETKIIETEWKNVRGDF